MQDRLDLFFNKNFTYVIVGASNNEDKYGFKIFKTLLDTGFKVIPVNPKEDKILNVKCYKSLLDIKENIDVVDFVVPAGVTLKVLEDVVKLGIKKVWFQPNTFDDKVLSFSRRNKLKALKDFCLLKTVLEKYNN